MGDTGAPGISNYSTHTNNSGNANLVTTKQVQVDCPAGTKPFGGGGEISPADTIGVALVSSYVRNNGWFVKAHSFVGPEPSWKLISHVVCARVG